MSKSLTKNARWICVLVESITDTPGAIPHRGVHNLERHSWDTLEWQAVAELNLEVCKPISTFLVDVDLIKYQKDWKKVSNMAINYFKGKGLLDKEYPSW